MTNEYDARRPLSHVHRWIHATGYEQSHISVVVQRVSALRHALGDVGAVYVINMARESSATSPQRSVEMLTSLRLICALRFVLVHILRPIDHQVYLYFGRLLLLLSILPVPSYQLEEGSALSYTLALPRGLDERTCYLSTRGLPRFGPVEFWSLTTFRCRSRANIATTIRCCIVVPTGNKKITSANCLFP